MSESDLHAGKTHPRRTSARRTWPLLLVGAVLLYWVIRPAGVASGWSTDLNAAFAEARKSDKDVLVAFTMPGCPPCVLMDRTVLSSKAVQEALEDFVPVSIDAVAHPGIARQFGVLGTPTYAIVDATGAVLAKREGYQSREEFVAFLRGASSRSANAQSAAGASIQAAF